MSQDSRIGPKEGKLTQKIRTAYRKFVFALIETELVIIKVSARLQRLGRCKGGEGCDDDGAEQHSGLKVG